jgi:hypothetical protein
VTLLIGYGNNNNNINNNEQLQLSNDKSTTDTPVFFIFVVGVPHLATYIFLNFQTKPELGAGFDRGMAFTPFPSSLLDETRFEPTIFRSRVAFANH